MYKSLFQGHFLKLVVWFDFAVTTHAIRMKGSEKHCRSTLAEYDSCIKHDIKMRFSLTDFSLQAIHLSSYVLTKSI